MLRWTVAFQLIAALHVYGRVCLPDAIPEFERKNVSVDGVSMPIGIWSAGWDSIKIVSSIYQILVEEKLGYSVSLGMGSTSKVALWKLAGCDHDPVTNEVTGGCGGTRHYHVTFEFWYATDTALPKWLSELGEVAPESLGSIGYSGKEGMHIFRTPVARALEDRGLALEYYRSYNLSWYDTTQYTATVRQVDMAKLKTCAESVEIGYQEIGDIYLAATGDAEGVEDKNGTKVLKCWQQKWWPSPACRTKPIQDCAAVITGKTGWGLQEMTQQACFHNMPLAFATAAVNYYVALNVELGGLFYWWVPDTAFAVQEPYLIMFPPNSPSQYKQDIYKTAKENVLLTNWMSKGLRDVADRPVRLAENLHLTDELIYALLVESSKQDAGTDAWELACNWLKQTNLWQEWLPNETACSSGQGLANEAGQFVMLRGQAAKCEPCPPGHQSIEQDTSRICVPCDAGYFQPMMGSSACLPCEPGSRSESEGAAACALCNLGHFANDFAMTSCHQCGPADQAERWTTSRNVTTHGEETWIQIQGASSESSCSCVEGTYLWNGRCEECIEGSRCPGSNALLLKPGYFSTPEAPGEVFQCHGGFKRCPGGLPGTCAAGRDSTSPSCAKCLPGLHGTEDVCLPCVGGDYALIAVVCVLCVMGIAILYIVLVHESQKSRQPGSLLIAALSLGQMVTVVQQLTVIQQFKIEWGQPFSNILEAMELMAFDLDMISISCLTPMSPVMKFTIRTLLVLLFFVVAAIVHFIYLLCKRAQTLKISLLLRTVGTLFMAFFISLCSSLLLPFRCNVHPNGRWTVQTYHEVFCDGTGEHLQMALVGGLSCLLPVCFLAGCIWIIVFELPKRLANADVGFIRACSFLFIRFRPGAEVFSVLFLARNALVVLCPLLPSAAFKVVCMNILLYSSIVVTALEKPWRAMACNFLDLALVTGMLVILDMGSLFVTEIDQSIVTWICLVFFILMLLAIVGAIFYGITKHFLLRYRKQFRFFLCHQKVAAGSLARLLKMELQKRSSRFTTFVDCDDLNDLTRLFSYVGQDTETLVVLASPDILTRKWCVGEICTARISRVNTVVLALPGYVNPDKTFIESYTSIVPDITELANYNLGLAEVEETLRWITTLQQIALLSLTPDTIDSVGNDLTGTFSKKSMSSASDPNCIILADLDNIEATATAYILLSLILPKLMGSSGNNTPTVLMKGQSLPKTATSALMICSEGCFRSADVASWLLAVKDLELCCILPIIAEDGFRFPSQAFYDDLVANQQLSKLDLDTYVRIIQAVFQEIAVVFSPQNYSSTQEDLDLRSKQVTWRLQSGALKPLAAKLAKPWAEVTEDVPDVSKHCIISTLSGNLISQAL